MASRGTAGGRGGSVRRGPRTDLPDWTSVLAVVAHPDDESFGLGALLAAFSDTGARASVLCFTHSEASTLHGISGGLHRIRAAELDTAARLLGLDTVELRHHPDGALTESPCVSARRGRRHGGPSHIGRRTGRVRQHRDHRPPRPPLGHPRPPPPAPC